MNNITSVGSGTDPLVRFLASPALGTVSSSLGTAAAFIPASGTAPKLQEKLQEWFYHLPGQRTMKKSVTAKGWF
jgi:hypothetical protein